MSDFINDLPLYMGADVGVAESQFIAHTTAPPSQNKWLAIAGIAVIVSAVPAILYAIHTTIKPMPLYVWAILQLIVVYTVLIAGSKIMS